MLIPWIYFDDPVAGRYEIPLEYPMSWYNNGDDTLEALR
jgi:hypothetical protein